MNTYISFQLDFVYNYLLLFFRISEKGNGTCELTFNAVRETADLKPIGTELDIDFDLYIKKFGCSVVIDKTPHDKPLNDGTQSPGKPDTLGNIKPHTNGYDNKPPDDGYDYQPPIDGYDHKPLQNDYDKPKKPNYYYLPPKHGNKDHVEHVQTIVSVASGPDAILHPTHDILIGKKLQQNEDGYGDMPPFRPPVLNRPYMNDRPDYHHKPEYYGDKPGRPPAPVHENADSLYGGNQAYGDVERPHRPVKRPIDCDPDYDNRPPQMKPDLGYNEGGMERPHRPFEDEDRPDPIYNKRPYEMRPDMTYVGFSSHSHSSHDLSVSTIGDKYDDILSQRPNDRYSDFNLLNKNT